MSKIPRSGVLANWPRHVEESLEAFYEQWGVAGEVELRSLRRALQITRISFEEFCKTLNILLEEFR